MEKTLKIGVNGLGVSFEGTLETVGAIEEWLDVEGFAGCRSNHNGTRTILIDLPSYEDGAAVISKLMTTLFLNGLSCSMDFTVEIKSEEVS